MTNAGFEHLRQKIAAAKFDPKRSAYEYAYQRGWNSALDWILGQMQVIEGEENERTTDRA